VGHAIPFVEITDDPKLKRLRRPFAVPDAGLAPEFAAIKAEIMMALADLAQQAAGVVELRDCVLEKPASLLELLRVRFQPGIKRDHSFAVAGLQFGHARHHARFPDDVEEVGAGGGEWWMLKDARLSGFNR